MDLPNMDHQLENILKICCCRALDNLRAWDTSRPSRATSDDSLDTVSQASSQSTEIWWRISKPTWRLCETSIVPNWPNPLFCGCIYVGRPVSYKFKMYHIVSFVLIYDSCEIAITKDYKGLVGSVGSSKLCRSKKLSLLWLKKLLSRLEFLCFTRNAFVFEPGHQYWIWTVLYSDETYIQTSKCRASH